MSSELEGLWMVANGFIKVRDTVGIKEPNLYTGVGVVKEKDRGTIIEIIPHLQTATVEFPQGRLMIFLQDLLFYERG